MTLVRAGVLAALALLGGTGAPGCSKDQPDCDVDAYLYDAIGTDSVTDCGTFQPGDPALTPKAIAAAQTCVVNAAQGKQSFRFLYDQEIDVLGGQDQIARRERARVGWVGTIDTGELVLRWYSADLDDQGHEGAVVLHTCEGVVGTPGCSPSAPDKSLPPSLRTSSDACLTCVNPGPKSLLCQ